MNQYSILIFITIIYSTYGVSSSVIQDINNKTYVCYAADEVKDLDLKVHSNVIDPQDKCECGHTYCKCCENEIEQICVEVRYYEVFHVPAAFGVQVTYNGNPIIDIVVNATNLPCIKMPLINNLLDICLQLYNIQDHKDHVSVCLKFRGHFIFGKWSTSLGCVKIPKLPDYKQGSIVTIDGNIPGGHHLQKLEYKTDMQLNNTSSTSSTFKTALNFYVILAIFGMHFHNLLF